MLGGLPYTALRDGIIAQPTLAEGLNMLFGKVRLADGRPDVAPPTTDETRWGPALTAVAA